MPKPNAQEKLASSTNGAEKTECTQVDGWN